MPLKTAQHVPVATYRVQLHAGFNFESLISRLDYLRSLGITDIYCSPIFSAAPGSTHGYDVSDYRTINAELGGDTGFRALAAALRDHGMGLLLDFVPNHMGINGPFNAWWRDVLEGGRHSAYADFFDIHWNSHLGSDRILVPMLETHYGVVLERGELSLRREGGTFEVSYKGMHLPLRPASYPNLLLAAAEHLRSDGPAQDELHSLAAEFSNLPRPGPSDAHELKQERAVILQDLKARLERLVNEQPSAADGIDRALTKMNGRVGDPHSFDNLHALLSGQHYRLARWKTGAHETNYRRFFAVDTLVGLRMERNEVFAESHRRLAELVHASAVTGLRIDHVDGLWDPDRYLRKLQEITRGKNESRPLYVLVEKILEGPEQLPANWLAHGTTGYEFSADLALLFTDQRSEARFTKIYSAFVMDRLTTEEAIYQSKRLVLDEMFANAIHDLARQLDELLASDRRWRDLTRHELTVALREIIAHMDVYRTYRRPDDAASVDDVAAIQRACTLARRTNARLDPEPFQLIEELMTGAYPAPDAPAEFRARSLGWVMSLQQYTGAVMAKSVEDTAFYVHNRLIALNEVGGDPARFGGLADEFHQACARRDELSPFTQLTTSTHDTKLSEDARARLYVLSEMPEEWEAWLQEWRQLNAPHKTIVDSREAPDANEEYRFYQTLLAVWPLDETVTDELRRRLRENIRKAVAEAKRNTTWINPNEPWLLACDHFVDNTLDAEKGSQFLASFKAVAGRFSRLGMINSLAQVALKLTTPGVPDIYQGNEVFDFSLVDPDNRRPVDFAGNAAQAATLGNRSWGELLRNWRDGAIKQRLTRELLGLRIARPLIFQKGDYVPLRVEGRFADHVVAFRRQHGADTIVVVVPRLTAKLGCPPLGPIWDNTLVQIPGGGEWRDILAGTRYKAAREIFVADLFQQLPLAVLHCSRLAGE